MKAGLEVAVFERQGLVEGCIVMTAVCMGAAGSRSRLRDAGVPQGREPLQAVDGARPQALVELLAEEAEVRAGACTSGRRDALNGGGRGQ